MEQDELFARLIRERLILEAPDIIDTVKWALKSYFVEKRKKEKKTKRRSTESLFRPQDS